MFKLITLPKIYSPVIRRVLLQNTIVRLTSTDSVVPSKKEEKVVDYEAEKAKWVELLAKDLPKPYDGPERDHVNFPRMLRPSAPGVIRHGFIPQEWLDFFYRKTGVTGPYVFGFGLVTFLLSKELYVVEEETSTCVAIFLVFYILFKKFGPPLAKYRDRRWAEELQKLEDKKAGYVKSCQQQVDEAKKMAYYYGNISNLMQAKRENVHIQLETEYRRRRMMVYQEVKRRLDYHLEMDTTKRQLEQKHMVNWIVQNVMKSITPQQEKDALQKCVADLKVLSARAV